MSRLHLHAQSRDGRDVRGRLEIDPEVALARDFARHGAGDRPARRAVAVDAKVDVQLVAHLPSGGPLRITEEDQAVLVATGEAELGEDEGEEIAFALGVARCGGRHVELLALAVEKEHRWLPTLAPQLPLPVPIPLAKGSPGAGYPHPWSVYGWLDGSPARFDRIADPVRFALDVAEFLAALQRVDPADGPRPGLHNWFRGGPLHTYDELAQRALTALDGRVDVGLAQEIWQHAMAADWDGVERWFHGDVAQGNLLLRDGDLTAVIDFGTCGVGDPACDLAIAWTLLTPDGRQAFRERLSIDDATWVRGRGWALWKALVMCAGTPDDADVRRALNEIFSAGGDTISRSR